MLSICTLPIRPAKNNSSIVVATNVLRGTNRSTRRDTRLAAAAALVSVEVVTSIWTNSRWIRSCMWSICRRLLKLGLSAAFTQSFQILVAFCFFFLSLFVFLKTCLSAKVISFLQFCLIWGEEGVGGGGFGILIKSVFSQHCLQTFKIII